MQLTLQRDPYLQDGTTGDLFVDGAHFCVTLERAKDDPNHPCIPAGIFPVTLRWSERFRRNMPRLENVPGRTAIEIHWGNFVDNSLGCVLVGATKVAHPRPTVWDSRQTFDLLYPKLEAAEREGIAIEVREAPEQDRAAGAS